MQMMVLFFPENYRNTPKIIEALSVDGSNGQLIESSNIDPSIGIHILISCFLVHL